MILKSYEIEKTSFSFKNKKVFLIYGENLGLKKNIKFLIKESIDKNSNYESANLHEDDILKDQNIFYDFIYSGSLFTTQKILFINNCTDKLLKYIEDIIIKFPEDITLVLTSNLLEKKSKLRNFFEEKENLFCIPCYFDTEKNLQIIAQKKFYNSKKNISNESLNLIIRKSGGDRDYLLNEIEKILLFAENKERIEYDEVKNLISSANEIKSDNLINTCLCGNLEEFKKYFSELYINSSNQILILKILSNKIQRLIKIKEKNENAQNLDFLINNLRPSIFWKEKPLLKIQLGLWNLKNLKNKILELNKIEFLCKKNPKSSSIILSNFLIDTCRSISSYS